ncbi:hypothetical protein [Ruminococcus flavefaciens]|uniref:hypothetical protein n=1 Tax=Ruminococcus flavefaciens TaxID=1265 RepID=UPI00048E8DFD|nr:hypothetical protein [Ruminococcus flavefaciens]
MKNILTKTNKTILSIFFALIVMVGIFTVMPDRALKAKAYSSSTYTCSCEGGTYYVSQYDATSYSGYYSWITVSKVVNGYYKVTVKPDTTVKTYNTFRTGYIYFKNSKGNIVHSLYVKQYQPYIGTNSTYLYLSKAATSYANFTVYSTCAYTIEYPSNLIVKTLSGALVRSGSTLGNNSTNGLQKYDYLKVYPAKANNGKTNLNYTIKLKKAGSYIVAKTINVTHRYY